VDVSMSIEDLACLPKHNTTEEKGTLTPSRDTDT
jgi:hypothetical protein